jgi:Fe2+ or Zn2+ uptake regulation protein
MMTQVSTPAPTSRLTEQAQKLLEILQAAKNPWMNRKDIAKAIGKRRLTPYDIALLELLQAQGLVEIQSRANGTPIGYEWVYHAQPDGKFA